jgi:hypothetical protein
MNRRRDSGKRRLTFLKNHREAIAAMDLFTVPTVTFRVLYCFFVISHSRRRILHFNVTEHPTSQWIVQQLREVFPEGRAPKYLVLDRDGKFSGGVARMAGMPRQGADSNGLSQSLSNPRGGALGRKLSPGTAGPRDCAERIPPSAACSRVHPGYYHEDRVHDILNKDTPTGHPQERRQTDVARVVGVPHVGGLHHRYHWQAPPEAHPRPSCSSSVAAAFLWVKATFLKPKPRVSALHQHCQQSRLRVRPRHVDRGGRDLTETACFLVRRLLDDRQHERIARDTKRERNY